MLKPEQIYLPELAVVGIGRETMENLVFGAEKLIGTDAVRFVAAEVLAVGAATAAGGGRSWS